MAASSEQLSEAEEVSSKAGAIHEELTLAGFVKQVNHVQYCAHAPGRTADFNDLESCLDYLTWNYHALSPMSFQTLKPKGGELVKLGAAARSLAHRSPTSRLHSDKRRGTYD